MALVAPAPRSLPPPPAVGRALPAPAAAGDEPVPATARRQRRLRRLFVAFGWMRNVGLILLLFAAWQLWGTSIQQAHAQRTLKTEFQQHVDQRTLIPAAPSLISADASVPSPKNGAVVGHLQIPAIGVDQYVVQGTNEGDLAEGPGHYVGTAMPGQAGNIAIAGHRTTYGAPFNQLDRLQVSDKIVLTTLTGEVLTYVVSQPPVAVSPNDVAVLNPFDDNRITLTTCNPKYSSSQRLVVVGLLSSPAPSTTTTVSVVPKRSLHIVSEAVGWNLRYLPEVLAIIFVMALLALANGRARRVYGRLGRVLVLVPIWSGALYLLFTMLTKLLPANL
jgi:sortase A